MIIKESQLNYIVSNSSFPKFILFYGPNEGLMRDDIFKISKAYKQNIETDEITINGNVSLTSGNSLTIDAVGLKINLGADLNMTGGLLPTDSTTNFHLLTDSTITTNAEQTVGNVTVEANQNPMLTLGGTTRLEVLQFVSITGSCPESLPIKPKAQLKLPGGVKIDTGGTLCIDGWIDIWIDR